MVENNYHVLEEDKEVYSDIWDKEKRALINYEVVDLLNEQEERIKELESENKMLKLTIGRNESYIKRLTIKIWKLVKDTILLKNGRNKKDLVM